MTTHHPVTLKYFMKKERKILSFGVDEINASNRSLKTASACLEVVPLGTCVCTGACQCTDCSVLVITQLIRNVSIVVAVAVFMVDDQ